MGTVLKIALRNLKEHKAKSLIIGIIIILGIMVLFISNSMMDTASQGIRKSFIDTYTGDIMISVKSEDKINLFGKSSNKLDPSVPIIPEYSKVHEHVTSMPEVASASSQVTGMAIINFEEKDADSESEMLGLVLFGIEPDNYQSTFSGNIEILDGEFLKKGEIGILLPENQVEEIRENMNISLSAGDSIVLSSFSTSGIRIREIPIKGIFRFKSGARLMDNVGLVDVQSLRSLIGLIVGAGAEIELDEEETVLLTSDSFDDLFTGDMVESSDTATESASEKNLFAILGDTSERTRACQVDRGAWHFILIKLKDPSLAKRIMEDLNNYFTAQGIQARAADWKAAAGMMGSFVFGIKMFINIVVIIVAVVAIIIIMNTLVISVIERTSEIGTMRALGAQKGFIRKLFILETLIISLVSGGTGIILGAGIIGVLNLTGLRATNIFLEVIFGGKVLHPVLSFSSLIHALGVVGIIGIVSSLYPGAIALKIQPVKAIQTE